MRFTDSKGMLLCIAAEVLLAAFVLLGGRSEQPAPESSADTTAVTETTSLPTATTTTTTAAVNTTVPPETTVATETTTTTTETTTTETTTTTTTTTTEPPPNLTPVPMPEVLGAEMLTEEDLDLLSGAVFVGDSITLGLKTYHVLPEDHVLAIGGIGVRNVLEQKYTVLGESGDIVHALTLLRPKYVFFTFGLNDINMTSAEAYCENYRTLLTQVHEALPNTVLCADSMTPVLGGIAFTTNTKIDGFNAALLAFVEESGLCRYIDIASGLKDSQNTLHDGYDAGDGIHLAPKTYILILKEICTQLQEPEPVPAETTAPPETE